MLSAYNLLFCALFFICAGDELCHDQANYDRLAEELPNWSQCGRFHENDRSIFSKKNPDLQLANLGEFPSVVRIRTEIGHADKDGKVSWLYQMCNGFLVTEQHVLTAASCLREPPVPRINFTERIIKVTVGDYNSEVTTKDCVSIECDGNLDLVCAPPPATIWVNRSVPHEYFNKFSLRHDIAVLELKAAVTLSDYVQPICLPHNCEMQQNWDSLFTTPLMMVGWRIYWPNRNASFPPSSTQKVAVELRRPGHVLYGCDFTYHWVDNSTQMCMFMQPSDKVNCDSYVGGPIISNVSMTWHVALGVVSYGESCRAGRAIYTGDPLVVTWIPPYVRWIMKTIYYLKHGHHFPYTFTNIKLSTGVQGD